MPTSAAAQRRPPLRRALLAATVLAAAAAAGPARAADDAAGGGRGHPLLLPRFERSEIAEYRSQGFEAVRLPKAPIADGGGRPRDGASFLSA